MRSGTTKKSFSLGEVVARFSIFTGFWAVAYFYMSLTALAVARNRWAFTVDLGALLAWFGVFVGVSTVTGVIIGIISNGLNPSRVAAAHNDFGGEFKNNFTKVVMFLVGTAVSGVIFLALAFGLGRLTERTFGFRLDVLDGVSLPLAALAVVVESATVTLLVLGIIFYVKRQYEAARST